MRKKNYQSVLSIHSCFSYTFFDIIHFYILNLKKNIKFKNISKTASWIHRRILEQKDFSFTNYLFFNFVKKPFRKEAIFVSDDTIPYQRQKIVQKKDQILFLDRNC